MSAPSKIYKIEDLKKIDRFDLDIEVNAESFLRVAYAYYIEGEIISCSLLRVNKRCNRKHNHGYVVELSNGQLGAIGKDCTKKHFSDDTEIRKAINDFEDQLSIKEKLKVIYGYIENYEQLTKSLNDAKNNTLQSFKNLREIYSNLGSYNCFLLQQRCKTAKPTVSVKAYKLNNKDEEIYQATYPLGTIPTLNIFNINSLNNDEYLLKFNRLEKALISAKRLELQLSRKIKNQKDKDLDFEIKNTSKQLQELDGFIKESKELMLNIEKFMHSDLNILCYLSSMYEHQLKAAEFSIAMNSLDTSPEVYLRSLEIKLATKFKCHRIKSE